MPSALHHPPFVASQTQDCRQHLPRDVITQTPRQPHVSKGQRIMLPRCGGQDLVPFPIQQPLVNRHHQLPTKNILPSCSLSLASNSLSQTRGTLARHGVILLQHLPEPRCKAQSLSLKVTAVPFAIQNSSTLLRTTAPLRPRSGDCRQTDPLSLHGACRQDQTSAVCYATEEA